MWVTTARREVRSPRGARQDLQATAPGTKTLKIARDVLQDISAQMRQGVRAMHQVQIVSVYEYHVLRVTIVQQGVT